MRTNYHCGILNRTLGLLYQLKIYVCPLETVLTDCLIVDKD